jgi:hypothetical protein
LQLHFPGSSFVSVFHRILDFKTRQHFHAAFFFSGIYIFPV